MLPSPGAFCDVRWFLNLHPAPVSFVARLEALDADLAIFARRFGLRPLDADRPPLSRARAGEGAVVEAAAAVGSGGHYSKALVRREAPDAIGRLVRHLRGDYACMGIVPPPLDASGSAIAQRHGRMGL